MRYFLVFIVAYLLIGSFFALKIHSSTDAWLKKLHPETPLTTDKLARHRIHTVMSGLIGWPIIIVIVMSILWIYFWTWPILHEYEKELKNEQ